MAVNANATYLANLVDPEVIGSMLETKLTDAIKFAPLAKVDNTLVGRAGDTVSLPFYSYIGIASVTPEGQPITINRLSQSTTPVKVLKIGNGVELTDEAVLSGYGDPMGEASDQLITSIADAIDKEFVAVLDNTKSVNPNAPEPLQASVASAGSVVADDIADALVAFGEDIDGEKVVLVNGADYANLRKDPTWVAGSDVGANIIIQGTVGMIHGCQVVVSNRVKAGEAYIVKPNALALFLKREAFVESDRDIINKSTVITADIHCCAYLLDATKAIKLS